MVQPPHVAASLAALTSVGAGGIHLAAAAPHLRDSVLLGLGFLGVGMAQVGLGGALWRRRRVRTALALGGVHLVATVVWAVSRTVGLPLGHPGPEAVGSGDLVTVSLQLLAVAALLAAWTPTAARSRLPRPASAFAVVALVAVAGFGAVDAAIGHHHGGDVVGHTHAAGPGHDGQEAVAAGAAGGPCEGERRRDATRSSEDPDRELVAGREGVPANGGDGAHQHDDGAHAHDDDHTH